MELTTEQGENAALIAAIGVSRGLPARAVSIALATAYQESKIRNLTHGDRDSLGLFQQRPSQGWGTTRQVRDPYYAINKFYDALEKIDDYKSMRITEAAQKVQRSGFPEAYEDHAADARALASVLTGFSPGGHFTCVVKEPTERGSARQVMRQLERAVRRRRHRPDRLAPGRRGRSLARTRQGQRLGWSVAQFVVAYGVRLHPEAVAYADKRWRTGRDSEEGWVSGRQGRRGPPCRSRWADGTGFGFDTRRRPRNEPVRNHRDEVDRQAGRRGGDALVGGGEGDPDVAIAGPAVEGARGDQDPAVGEPVDGVPAGFVAGGPEVERRFGVVDPETGRLERRPQRRTTSRVARVLLGSRARRRRGRRSSRAAADGSAGPGPRCAAPPAAPPAPPGACGSAATSPQRLLRRPEQQRVAVPLVLPDQLRPPPAAA